MEGIESESNEEEEKNIGLPEKQLKIEESGTSRNANQNKEVTRGSNSTVRAKILNEKGRKLSQTKQEIKQGLLESLLRAKKANMKKIINKKMGKKLRERQKVRLG